MSQDEDEWEFEYDQDATETHLLDLDITSLNGSLKSNIPGKRPLDRPEPTGKAKARHTEIRQQSTPIDMHLNATSSTSIGLEDPFSPAPNSVQLLDFHTLNPIISYQQEVYSCTWSDMIGTNIFFAPSTRKWPEPEEPVEVLGVSRIRLVCHKAKTTVKQDTNAKGIAERERASKGPSSVSSSGYPNVTAKRQADFLERLREVKKAKGDTDIVRSVITEKTSRSKSSDVVPSSETNRGIVNDDRDARTHRP